VGEWWRLLLGLVGSFGAGYLGSALGLVLGTLRLPLILLAAGSPTVGAGTNIAISAAAAGTGGLRHAREGRVDWRVVGWMAPPSIVGAVAGSLAASHVSHRLLYGLVAAVLLWSAIDLAFRPIKPRPRVKPRLAAAAFYGIGIGAIGGAIGVILGTLRMPALVRSVGIDLRTAAGTNLVVGFMLGLAGFLSHAASLDVDWPLLAVGLAGAMPGAWLGARHTATASEHALRLALAVTLVAVACAFAIEAAA
jgi:uncharacterized membrane protein YfcA